MDCKYLFLNWKMFGSKDLIKDFCHKLNLIENKNTQTAFFPPVIYLDLVSNLLKSSKIGVQDFSFYDKSNLTGDISLEMLQEFAISYAIIGHSERISNYSEEYFRLNKKLKLLEGKNINPIICFGEAEKLSGDEFGMFVSEFLLYILDSLANFDQKNVFLAYEPVWAIGAGNIDDIGLISRNIKIIKDIFKKHNLENVKLIYGGSVNDANISDLENSISVDGYLIGSAGRDFNCIENILNYVG